LCPLELSCNVAYVSTEDNQDTIRASRAVVVLAWVIGTLGGLFMAGVALIMTTFGGHACGAILVWMIVSGLIGVSAGAGLVGLCSVLGGAKLGRYFSYPFAGCLAGFLVMLSWVLLRLARMARRAGLFETLCGAGLGLAVVCGVVLAKCIRRYGRGARIGSAVGLGAMLLIGVIFLRWITEGLYFPGEDRLSYLVAKFAFALFGGILGAVLGQIVDGLFNARLQKKPLPPT